MTPEINNDNQNLTSAHSEVAIHPNNETQANTPSKYC